MIKYSELRRKYKIEVDKTSDNGLASLTHFIQNRKNGVSLLKAASFVQGDCLLSMADHLFSPELVRRLRQFERPAVAGKARDQLAPEQRAGERGQKRRAGGNGEDVGDGQGGLGAGRVGESLFVMRGGREGKRAWRCDEAPGGGSVLTRYGMHTSQGEIFQVRCA